MSLTLITPPVTAPVSIEEARRQCRVHSSDTTYDAELHGYLNAAVSHVEETLSIALEPQTWRLTLDAFDSNITLPLGPVIEIDSISYDAGDVAFTPIEASDYALRRLSSLAAEIAPVSSWPTALGGMDKVIVDFTAGYEGELDSATYTSGVPAGLRQAILLYVRNLFEPFDDQAVFEKAFDGFLKPYVRPVLA